MHASHIYQGDRLAGSAIALRRGDHGAKGVMLTFATKIASIAEDLVILAQFAFGREYVSLKPGQKRP